MILIDDLTDGPGVCALVIGVGSFHPSISTMLGMKSELSTATASAIAFGNWVGNKHRHPAAPLRYLDVLISAAGDCSADLLDQGRAIFRGLDRRDRTLAGNEVDWDYEPATSKAIVEAMKRWNKRIDKDFDNVAVFYFCGHGAQIHGVSIVFPGDYDVMEENWIELIGIDDFFNATAGSRARNKYFFTDACRDVPKLWKQLERVGTNPVLPNKTGAVHSQDARHWVATRNLTQAFGVDNEPTLFTYAVLAALNGMAAEPVILDGAAKWQWGVSSNRVKECVNTLLERQRKNAERMGTKIPFQEPQDGTGTSGMSKLFHLPGPEAEVLADFTWTPTTAVVDFHPRGGPAGPAYFTASGEGAYFGRIPLPPAKPNPTFFTVTCNHEGEPKNYDPDLCTIHPPGVYGIFTMP